MVGTVVVDAPDRIISRVGVIIGEHIIIRSELTVHVVGGESRQVEESHEAETLRDEAEVLVELHGRDHLGTLVVTVAAHEFRIRVVVRTVVVVTEHDVSDALVLFVGGVDYFGGTLPSAEGGL